MTETIGEYLRTLRKGKKLTLLRLQEESGVSNSYLSQIENNQFTPSPDILKKISDPLGVPYSQLMAKAGYMPMQTEEDNIKMQLDKYDELIDDLTEEINKTRDIEGRKDIEFLNFNYLDQLVDRKTTLMIEREDLARKLNFQSFQTTTVDEGLPSREITDLLSLKGLKYKNKPISEKQRKQILQIAEIIFNTNEEE